MTKSVEFYYAKESNNKKDSKIDVYSYVRVGDGGYDYYLISLFLKDNSVEYTISKITNIFTYITKHKIKLSKIDNKLNDNLYKFLIKILWDYIDKNQYTTFDLSGVNYDQSSLYNIISGYSSDYRQIEITSSDIIINTNNRDSNTDAASKEIDLKKLKK